MTTTDQIIEEIIGDFEKEFCNNHQKPIRFLRSIFYDEQDGAEKIENFLKDKLQQISAEWQAKVEEARREQIEKDAHIASSTMNDGNDEVSYGRIAKSAYQIEQEILLQLNQK